MKFLCFYYSFTMEKRGRVCVDPKKKWVQNIITSKEWDHTKTNTSVVAWSTDILKSSLSNTSGGVGLIHDLSKNAFANFIQ